MASLIVMGDLQREGDPLQSVQLWRCDSFRWGETLTFLTERRCVPRRYFVIDDGQILATGETEASNLVPGETYVLLVPPPA